MKRKNWKEMQRLARLCEAHAANAASPVNVSRPGVRYIHESIAAKYAAQAFELSRSV